MITKTKPLEGCKVAMQKLIAQLEHRGQAA